MVIDGTHTSSKSEFTSLLLRPAVLLAHGTGAQAPSMPTYGPCYASVITQTRAPVLGSGSSLVLKTRVRIDRLRRELEALPSKSAPFSSENSTLGEACKQKTQQQSSNFGVRRKPSATTVTRQSPSVH